MHAMAVAALLVVAAACKGDAPKPASGSGSSVGAGSTVAPSDAAIAADAAIDAGIALRDLFRTVPLVVRVSSRVVNATQKIEHLVDRDLNTAWNSRTNDLVGAWIAVELPDDVTVHEIRLTAGHTGKGAKGEDYFTMNQRVKKVTVSHAYKPLASFELDVQNRALQTFALPAPVGGGFLQIKVDALVPGSKRTWKEVCVSELELWGIGPVGPSTNVAPRVIEDESSRMEQQLCTKDELEQAYPTCSIETANAKPPRPWVSPVVLIKVTDRSEHHGHLYSESIERKIVLATDTATWTTDVVSTSNFDDPGAGDRQPHSMFEIESVEPVDAIAGGPPELALVYAITFPSPDPAADDVTNKLLLVCATDKRCAEPIEIAGDARPSDAAPPAPWSVTWKITPGFVTLTKDAGMPPTTGKRPLGL